MTDGTYPYYTDLPCVPKYTAYNSPQLEEIVLPQYAVAIREYAFTGSEALRSVTLPPFISEIHKGAFTGCPNITTVICQGGMPPIMRDENFGPDRQNITLYVPKGFREVYASDPQWGRFGTIIEDEDITCTYTPDMLPTRNLKATNIYKALVDNDKYFDYAVYDEETRQAAIVPVHTCLWYVEDDGYPIYVGNIMNWHSPYRFASIMDAEPKVTINGKEYDVTAIGNHAFCYMHLSSNIISEDLIIKLEIPEFITHIGKGAFYNCVCLNTVLMHSAVPPTVGDSRVFGDKSQSTLIVPEGAVEAYAEAEVWKEFGTITTLATLGVTNIDADLPAGPDTYYSIDGRRLPDRPAQGTIHIVRHADGSADLAR